MSIRSQYLSIALVAVWLSSVVAFAQQAGDQLNEQIAKLITDLDADEFQIRENAEQELLRIGKPAIAAVKKTVESAKGEVRTRCRRILSELVRSIRIVENVRRPDLDYVVSTAVSDDGNFLYSAAWKAKAITAFSRDNDSGKLTHIQTLTDADLNGVVCLRLNANSTLAAASSFTSKSIMLLARDKDSGKLTKTFVFKSDANAPRVAFPTENAFSPDSRFLFVLDSSAVNQDQSRGAIIVLEVTKDQTLKWVETNAGKQSCFNDARGIAFRPGKNQFYVSSSGAGAVVTVSWDKDTGKLTVDQDLRDETNGVKGLAGAMSVATTADGKFVYTSSGRFRGDSAVGVYAIQADGTLKVMQEFISGRDAIGQFLGGNELLVSQDGKNVYATGTRSATLAAFSRDAETGKLKFLETVSFCGQELGPAGLAIDPEGKYVYVAVEGDSSIAIFRREPPQ